MDEQERVIQELERALNAKINPLKLAETRLENRKMRPHMVNTCSSHIITNPEVYICNYSYKKKLHFQ